MKRGQAFDATQVHFYEGPMNDPDYLEVWCYTDNLSYETGEVVNFHLNTTAKVIDLRVQREGGTTELVHHIEAIEGQHYATPDDFFKKGCGWPVGYSWTIPDGLASGFYLVTCTVDNAEGETREHEAGFFVRPKVGKPTANILLIAATSTWVAYNDWGGTSNYVGFGEELGLGKSSHLTIHRPWAKGFLSLPGGAPRKTHEYKVRAGDIPRYPPLEFAYSRGYSKYYANAGWATYEQPFAQWAEKSGYSIDYATQHDLHFRPELLNQYACVITLGHDEYWSRDMRLGLDRYIEQGGNFARFGGNFAWQIRLEDDGNTQVCYKEGAARLDPLANEDNNQLLTSGWEDPLIDWHGAETVGLNAHFGVYALVGHLVPRHGGSFTVYRPEHWALKGTDLCYGDQFGGEARIFGYEVDGLDYTFQFGLPEPRYTDGAIPGTQIIAMGLASNAEANHGHKGTVLYYGDVIDPAMTEELAEIRYGEINERTRGGADRGNGMIIACQKGKGQIFNAGSCEWVAGLKLHDADTEVITRNVLDRFSRGAL